MPVPPVAALCPRCGCPLAVRVHAETARRAAAGEVNVVYERCGRCQRTFAFTVPGPDRPTR